MAQFVQRPGGAFSSLNISADTIVATVSRTLYRVIVNTPGSTAGAIYDANASANNLPANLILSIPTTAVEGDVYEIVWPCLNGISVVTGTGMVLALSYSP